MNIATYIKLKTKMIYLIIFIPLILFISFWVCGFVYANSFTTKTINLGKIKKILIVFPHADDETLSSGGVISKLSQNGAEIHWIILTKGERGNGNATFDEKLKEIRIEEAKKVAQIYGIKNLIQMDYPDDGVDAYKDKLSDDLKREIKEINPDLIITFDLAGLYGHPDHMVVSEVTTNLIKKDFPTLSCGMFLTRRKYLIHFHFQDIWQKTKHSKTKESIQLSKCG